MAAPASLNAVLENQIPLLLNKAILNLEPKMTSLFKTMVTSENVTAEGMSQKWQVKKLIKGSMAGVIQADDTQTSTDYTSHTIYGTNPSGPNRFYFNDGTLSEYPDPTLGAAGRVAQITVNIRAFRGSFELTLGELRHDNLPALIGQIIPDKIAGVAQQAVYHRAAHVWADDENGLIGTTTIGSESSSYGGSISAGVYDSTELGTTWYIRINNDMVSRFAVGMVISIANSSDAALTDGSGNVLAFYVKAVDRYTDRIVLWAKGNKSGLSTGDNFSATTGAIPAAAKFYTYKGVRISSTKSRAVDGVNAWLRQGYSSSQPNYVAAATGIYGLAFTDWPEMQSLTYTDSGALTEEKLGRYLDRLSKAFTPHGFSIDTLVVNSATLRPFANQKIGYSMIQRTGSPISLSGQGVDLDEGIQYHHNGRTYTIMCDEFVADGILYGLKVKNNLKRYVPPATPGASGGPNMPPYLPIEFVNTALGGSSIFDQKRGANNIVTEMKYAPFDYRMNVVPDQFAGMKISGLATNKLTPA